MSTPYTTREQMERTRVELLDLIAAAESGKNVTSELVRKTHELEVLNAKFKAATPPQSDFQRALSSGTIDAGMFTDTRSGAKGLAGAVADAHFHYKSNSSVTLSGSDVFAKANVFPASTALSVTGPGDIVPLGRDTRFLWPTLPQEDAGTNTAVSDFVQSARTLTGTVERAVDATTTKANLDVTIAATVEAIKQFAVTINSVPNVVLESMSQMGAFLAGQGQFQVNKALDDHVLAQIVAASPAFGNTGSTTIEKVRNAITSMRALGANPDVLVINPTDLAALELLQDGDGRYQFPINGTGTGPLWGLRVVERVGGGTDPMYLLDTRILGQLYLGRVKFDADPYTEFKKNLTTLRVEMNALFHIRNIQGARRIAAS